MVFFAFKSIENQHQRPKKTILFQHVDLKIIVSSNNPRHYNGIKNIPGPTVLRCRSGRKCLKCLVGKQKYVHLYALKVSFENCLWFYLKYSKRFALNYKFCFLLGHMVVALFSKALGLSYETWPSFSHQKVLSIGNCTQKQFQRKDHAEGNILSVWVGQATPVDVVLTCLNRQIGLEIILLMRKMASFQTTAMQL